MSRLYLGADPVLAGLGLALVLLGLVAITSASIGYAEAQFGNPWHHAAPRLRFTISFSVLCVRARAASRESVRLA